MEETPTAPPKITPPPSVIINENEDWTLVRKILRDKGIQFTKANITEKKTKVFPKILNDFRNMTKEFHSEKIAYYKYTLDEDKIVHAVIRRLPNNTEPTTITKELEGRGYTRMEVNQLISRRRRRSPCFGLRPKTGRSSNWTDLVVTVETKDASPSLQMPAVRIHAVSLRVYPRCIKCTGNHLSID